jgi:hypothetical protein
VCKSGGKRNANTQSKLRKASYRRDRRPREDDPKKAIAGLKPKDLVGQPWRLAFALQADGWWLRSDIVWSKPNPMPESCRDRPTKAHEYVFMLTKAARYFFDQEAVREGDQIYTRKAGGYKDHHKQGASSFGGKGGFSTSDVTTVGRNIRSVWTIPTQPFPSAHFATFPEELPRRCIAAGTSEKGCCPKCGAPWVRVVEKGKGTPDPARGWDTAPGAHGREKRRGVRGYQKDVNAANPHITHGQGSPNAVYCEDSMQLTPRGGVPSRTTGWKRGCRHKGKPVACTVLDPFSGAGTTGLVAVKMGRDYVGIEINPEYAEMAERRICDSLPLLIGD